MNYLSHQKNKKSNKLSVLQPQLDAENYYEPKKYEKKKILVTEIDLKYF